MAKVYGRLALIALLLYAGVHFWYGRVEDRLQGKPPVAKKEAAPPSPVQKPAESESVPADYHIILTRNIFKAALELGEQPSGGQPQTDVEDLAETKMQLVLLGTVAGSKADARAIIRNEKTKQEDIYHIGSALYGATITRIGRGKVVLQINGREEVLNIKDPENGGPQQVVHPSAGAPQPEMQGGGAREQPVPVVVPQRRISFRNPNPTATEPATPEPAAPEPAAPESTAAAPSDSGTSPSVGDEAKSGEEQPVPHEENTGQQGK